MRRGIRASAELSRVGIRTPFAYDGLSKDDAAFARATAERVRERHRLGILETGRDLAAVKARLEHGSFLNWIDAEFGMTPRTAQNYLSAFAEFGDKSEIVSHLPATLIYQLAAPSTPPAIREKVIKLVEGDKKPSTRHLTTIVSVARREVREARTLAERKRIDAKKRDRVLAGLDPKERARLERKEHRDELRRLQWQQEREAERVAGEKRERARGKALSDVVALLRKKLGDDYATLVDLLDEIDGWGLVRAIKEAA